MLRRLRFCRTFALRKRIKNKLAMKKQTMITLALALTLAMPTLPAFAQKAMSKKEIAEKKRLSRTFSILGRERRWLTSATPSQTLTSRHQK